MKVILGLGIVIVVSLYSVWPMARNLSSVPNFGTDGELLVWIMNQKKLFDGNAFYPYKNTLAYSDRMLLSGLSSRLPVLITGNPATAFGFNLVMGQLLSLTLIYLFWVFLFKNPIAAAIATIALGLSQLRMEYQVHLQMWNMQYWLLGLLLLWRYNHKWQIYLGFILLGIQFWESPLPVYFSLLVISVRYSVFKVKISKHHIIGIILAGLILFPMARAYLSVSKEFDVVRDIREAAHNSISINDLWGRFASPGLVVLLALSLLITPSVLRTSPPDSGGEREGVRWLWIVLFASLMLSFGPALKWHGQTVKILGIPLPLPYAPAYYIVPGLNAFRTPSRWLFVSGLAASGLIAYGLSKSKLNNSKLLIFSGLIILTSTTVSNVRELPSPNQYPEVYQWLKNQPGKVILELPRYTWAQEDKLTYRMFYSLLHGKLMVDGYSGFTPPQITLEDIDYTIVHLDEGGSATIEGELIWQNETTRVYSNK